MQEGDEREIKPITKCLVFATISVGIGEITEDNAPEFFARLRIVEELSGRFLSGPSTEDLYIKPEDVHAHIGLSTNVSYETREEWAQRIIIGDGDGLRSSGDRAITEEEREQEISKLDAEVEQLYMSNDYEAAERLERKLERKRSGIDVSVTRDIRRLYTHAVKKVGA